MDEFLLDKSARRPGLLLYEQIKRHFEKRIRQGHMASHEPLPGTMVLAKELEISHLTIRKAYKLLEEEGLVYSVQGKGTLVSESVGRPTIAVVTWLDQLAQRYTHSSSAAIMQELVHVIEADGCVPRLMMLTTSRNMMYEGRWNDHDRELLDAEGLRAVYFTGTDLPAEFVEQCQNNRIPLVGVSAARRNIKGSVAFDPEALVRMAGECLKERGRKRPALIFLDTTPGGDRECARRYGRLLRDVGGFKESIQTIGVALPTSVCGQAAARQLLESSRQIDSLVCLDDVIHQGVGWACHEKGVRVPEDLLLISQANKGLTPPFLVPTVRLNCDYVSLVDVAHQTMNRMLENKPIDDLPRSIAPELTHEDVLEDTRVEMYAEAI